jgi:hypothetical protein
VSEKKESNEKKERVEKKECQKKRVKRGTMKKEERKKR